MSRKKDCMGWLDFDWATEGMYNGRVPKAMNQADKVKALVAAGVEGVKIQEQLGMSKASFYRCLRAA